MPKSTAKRLPDATRLIACLLGAEAFHTASGEEYITIKNGGRRHTLALRSTAFREQLAYIAYQNLSHGVSNHVLDQTVMTLCGQARYEGPERPVFVRMAEADGQLYVDLADDHGRAIKITFSGWVVVVDPPVRFYRPDGMQPLPVPVPDGSIDELRPFVNVRNDGDFVLVVSWLVQAFFPKGPYPVLVLEGEHGSAKSTTARVLRTLIDPNAAPIRHLPKDARDLMIQARKAWMLVYDNVSALPQALSDDLCRLSTGGGFTTRALYTNNSEVVFDGQRPIILNGIETFVIRPDLLDRAIRLDLPEIPKEQRRTEEVFWAAFEEARPRIFAALLNALVAAFRDHSKIDKKDLPRMADFWVRALAAESGLGWPKGTVRKALDANAGAVTETAIEASLFAQAILKLVGKKSLWRGTATQLGRALNRQIKRSAASDPRAVSNGLKRVAPVLRQRSIRIEWKREKKAGTRMITIRDTSTPGNQNGLPPKPKPTKPTKADNQAGVQKTLESPSNPATAAKADDADKPSL